jgi:siroheme synthase
LKGGDPLIFASGGEELAALAAAGIACEIVPGVTAATGAAAAARGAVSGRGGPRGVGFVSGHTADGTNEPPWAQIAAMSASASICVYMGLKKLPQIAARLIAAGLPPTTPLTIVSKATHPGAAIFHATLAAAAAPAFSAKIPAPALVLLTHNAASG